MEIHADNHRDFIEEIGAADVPPLAPELGADLVVPDKPEALTDDLIEPLDAVLEEQDDTGAEDEPTAASVISRIEQDANETSSIEPPQEVEPVELINDTPSVCGTSENLQPRRAKREDEDDVPPSATNPAEAAKDSKIEETTEGQAPDNAATGDGNDGGDKEPPLPPQDFPEEGEGEDDGGPEDQDPTEEETAEISEKGLPSQVVVEEKIVDDVPVTAVLCPPESEHAADVAEVLAESDIIAITTIPPADEKERHDIEDYFTKLMSSEEDPAWVDQESERAAAQGDYLGEVFAGLRGTDKRAVVVCIGQDDPEYGKVVQTAYTDAAYDDAVARLAPPQEARLAAQRHVYALKESHEVRANRAAARLQTLLDVHALETPPPSVGVISTNEQFRSIDAIGGERVDVADTTPLEEKTGRTASFLTRAMRAAQAGDHEAVEAFTDQHLISQYVAHFIFGMEAGEQTAAFDHAADVIKETTEEDPEWPSRTLQSLDVILSNMVGEARTKLMDFTFRWVADEVFKQMLPED